MSSNVGANARVSIPSSARKTIQNIKEIGVNHSDEDVYAMLKECNMDPNETVQRLLFLDTFHEVKRKRDKKKENVNGRVFDDLRRKVTNQVRGGRSGRGSYSSQYAQYDAGSGMRAVVRKENGFEDRGSALQSPAKLMEKISPATVKNPTELSNGGVIVRDDKENSGSVDTVLQKEDTNTVPIKTELTLSESDGNTDLVIEMKDSALSEKELGSSHEHELTVENLIKNQHARVENSELIDIVQPESNGDILVSEELLTSLTNDKSSAADSLVNDFAPTKAIEDSTSNLEKLKLSEGQHVILPDHIQVSDAVKNVLSFGSLGSCFSVGLNNNIASSDSNGNSKQTSDLVEDGRSNEGSEESVEDEIAKKVDSCDEDTPSSADEESHCDPPLAPQAETKTPTENKDPALKVDQLNQEIFPAAIPQHAIIQTPTYNFGFMPPLLGSPPIPLEGHDHQHQVHLSNYMNGNTTSAPTPLPAQSIPSSVVVSVQPVPLLRQPYPPNFIPYAHYLSPFFMPPTFQFVGHGAFPPPLPNGNMYMASAATPSMKASPQYKLGVSNANDDLLASMLKDNSVYLGHQNSFYNLPPQGQHIAHTAFPAMYHPALQTVSAPLLQPGQSMSGLVNSVGLPQPPPPPPERHQMSWNNTY